MIRWVWMLSLVGAITSVHSEPLTFAEALDTAVRIAPDVEMQTAGVEAAKSSAIAAGRLPDPKLAVGIDNLPVNGEDKWSTTRDFMTMRKVGVMQDVPNSSKRRAERDIATAAIDKSDAERRVRILQIRRDTALAWLNRFYVERRAALFDELDRENRLFADAVEAQLAGGRGIAADVVMPQQEAAELADRRDELAGEIAKAKAKLRRWIGVQADEQLSTEPPALDVDPEHLRAHVHEHPDLAVFTPLTDMAQAEVHAAEAAKRPDWGVELSYGRRGAAFSDMASVQFTVGLPLFSHTRQDPQIEAKRHDLSRVKLEREAMLRDHTQELESDLADYEKLTRQLKRMQETHVPLARRKVDYQFASYGAGKGDLSQVLSARRELIDLELKQLDLEREQSQLAAKLHFSYGEGAK